jgi:hypothetical protein
MEDSMINSETASLYEEIRDDDVKTGRWLYVTPK